MQDNTKSFLIRDLLGDLINRTNQTKTESSEITDQGESTFKV